MKNRNLYSKIEDFLNDISFRKWIVEGVDEKGWEFWTLEDVSRAKLVQNARDVLYVLTQSEIQVSEEECHGGLAVTWAKIDMKKATSVHKSKFFNTNNTWLRFAAILILLTVVAIILIQVHPFMN